MKNVLYFLQPMKEGGEKNIDLESQDRSVQPCSMPLPWLTQSEICFPEAGLKQSLLYDFEVYSLTPSNTISVLKTAIKAPLASLIDI